MRRLALSLALVPLLAVVPLATPAYAGDGNTCATLSGPPHLELGADGIHAYGTFACAGAVTGMTVTVCIDQHGFDDTWWELGCATTTAADAKPHLRLTGTVVVPMLI